jgi:hypothetical protein
MQRGKDSRPEGSSCDYASRGNVDDSLSPTFDSGYTKKEASMALNLRPVHRVTVRRAVDLASEGL